MAPIIKSGTISMTGSRQRHDLGFDADIVFAYLEDSTNAKPWLWWSKTSWVQRTQRVGALDSFADGLCGVRDNYLLIGADAQANVSGATLHYLAIKDNKSGLIGETGWIGSTLSSWSPIVGDSSPSAIMIKRDSNLAPAAWFNGMAAPNSVIFDGTGVVTDAITAVGAGNITVGSRANVNQLSGGAIGEGHDCLSFWPQAGLSEPVTWTGNGASSRTIAHTVSNPVACIVVAYGPTTKGGFKLASMGTKMTDAQSTALFDNAITSLSGGIVTGSDTRFNANGTVYYALVFGQSDVAEQKDRFVFGASDPGAVFLRGSSTSNVDCGVDNSLSMAGAFSLEWWGKVMHAPPTNGGAEPFYFMARSAGDEGRADSDGLANGAGTRLDGTWSWGLGGKRFTDLDWDGPQFFVCTTNYCNTEDNSGSENDIRTKPWRTGILIPQNRLFHVVTTHDGAGRWNLFLNRKLVKQRLIDMTGVTLTDDAGTRVNAGAGSGHRTVLGGRRGTSAISRIATMVMSGASVYNSELTQAQVTQLYNRNFLGDTSYADVTPVERWLAADVSGTSWPAKINSANNGTLTSASKEIFGRW